MVRKPWKDIAQDFQDLLDAEGILPDEERVNRALEYITRDVASHTHVAGHPTDYIVPIFSNLFGLTGRFRAQSRCVSDLGMRRAGRDYELTFENSPTGDNCWTMDYLRDVQLAFDKVDQRISRSITDVFGGLTFMMVDSGVEGNALTEGSTIKWNKDSMDSDNSIGIQYTVVHELGHVLQNRTDQVAEELRMANVVKGRVWQGSLGSFFGNPSVPDRFKVSSNPSARGGTLEMDPDINLAAETAADYFLFWIYESFSNDTLGQIASIFADGGLIIRNNQGTGNPDAYPYFARTDQISNTKEEYESILDDLIQKGIDPIIIKSPGMLYWINSASR